MKKRLIYVFVFLLISLIVISGCENIKGININIANNNLENNNIAKDRENIERELINNREYISNNNLVLREAQENVEFIQTPLESELGIEQPKYHGYIIKFEDKPIIERKIELEENVQARRDVDINAQLDNYYNELVSQHNGIKSSFSNRIDNFNNKIKGEYYKTFNGIALDINEQELNEIRNLPNVKNVYPNYEVNISSEGENFRVDERVPAEPYNPYRWHLDITNVQDVWNLGYTGEGITIAIIDTGIDSNHNDLRGKIIDEYCYSEFNACPNGQSEQHGRGAGMDDMGHGTHVAGIATGNLFGAAPSANLVSIKVLNSEGSGTLNDVIKGIEISVDPNEDNNFEDHYDIISMSLGYDGGSPDSPDAIAVDNAVNLGVIAVIAAGNSGSNYGTVGCPGCARKAITIGASDRDDNIAGFSSRGPTSIGTIKPDIVAPGVLICSSRLDGFNPWEFNGDYQLCYDNEHVLLSGTSMATPLVAGAVALIKQAHPDWSPAEIKIALRNTGVDLNENVLTQGYGRVNVLEAVSLEHAPPVAELFTSGEVNRTINIEGMVGSRNYSLYYGEGRDPREWIEIDCEDRGHALREVDGRRILQNLCSFDTSYINDEEYTLKLLVVDNNEQFSEDHTLINVNNIEITYPPIYSYYIFRVADIVEIKGSILNNGLQNYVIEYGLGEEPEEWFTEGIQLVNNGRNNINNGVLAYWDTSLIDEPNFYTLRLKVNTDRIIYYENTTIYLGYYNKIINFTNYTGESTKQILMDPVISDLEGDKINEIVVAGSFYHPENLEPGRSLYRIFVFVLNDRGNIKWYRELTTPFFRESGETEGNYLIYNNLLVEDIDGDGIKEIIFSPAELTHLRRLDGWGMHYGKMLFVLSGINGTDKEGWPYFFEGYPLAPYEIPYADPIISDIDNDGNKEIISLITLNSAFETYSPKIMIFNNTGSLIFERSLGDRSVTPILSSPLVANVDNDEYEEIFIVLPRYIYRIDINYGADNHNLIEGNISQIFRSNDYIFSYESSPALGNVDADREPEIIIKGIRFNPYLYVFDINGSIVNNWPRNMNISGEFWRIDAVGDPILADIDRDGNLEIVISEGGWDWRESRWGGRLFALEGNGSLIKGFPFSTQNMVWYTPKVYNLFGDAKLEILISDHSNNLYFLSNSGELLYRSIIPIGWIEPRRDFMFFEGTLCTTKSVSVGYVDRDRNIDVLSGSRDGKLYWLLGNRTFSCSGEYFMTWRDNESNIIRQNPYNILSDRCNGFRCLSNNNEISPACYNEQQCNEVCTGSNLCLDIDEWQGICEEQEPREEPYCGNGIKEGTERCDGDDWGNVRDCTDLGYDGGRLRCVEPDEIRQRGLIPCRFDISQCYYEEGGEEIPEQEIFPGIIEDEIIQKTEIPVEIQEVEEIQPVIPETQPILEDINLNYLVTDNQVILEWDNIVSGNNEISARSVIEITGNAIRKGNFFSNIINAIKNLFKPKVRGIRLEDNLYRIYKSTDVNNLKQELIIEGSKEDFNCNIKCKFNYVEDEEGIYYYSVEINGNVFSVGPIEIIKKEVIPGKTTLDQSSASDEIKIFNEKTPIKKFETN